ncbi:phosphatidylserine decarboxylase family protein [Xanthovirga aplysinae]|uniref:phosphatidylserine decarboxylase family protein n=1 Tax=Xanthovirga aplysinae TaxID=2529853 RepID=UPI0012BC86E8|nr:phosphatidylserine decarboxylase family protein [Xanthovirga aplysinae]MTI31359.1 phosphatidylserine decarboxylase family protein [Xanthovirga aplysinae]
MARNQNQKIEKKSTKHKKFPSNFEVAYKRRFGVISGYLPKEIKYIGKWLSNLVKKAAKEKKEQGKSYELAESIKNMEFLLENNPQLKEKVNTMIHQGLNIHHEKEPLVEYCIETISDMLMTMNYIIGRAPRFEPELSHSTFPMSGLFVYMMATNTGWEVFRDPDFNTCLRNILQAWCDYLDSPDSLNVITTSSDGWLSPYAVKKNKLSEFVNESQIKRDPVHWGFKSYNDYFHRQIIDITRPVDGVSNHIIGGKIQERDNKRVIVSANDGTVYRIARKVKKETDFEIKDQPYSLENMLDNRYVGYFVGGDVFQTFLNENDYHRWRSPISGTVVYQKVVPGFLFSELQMEGWDPTAGTYSQGYEANVNTRGLIFIESDDPTIGMVCVMPIGITEISSVNIQVKAGQQVKKGEELGWFNYGGSSMCLIFKKGAIAQFTVSNPHEDNDFDDGPFVRANAQIAIANSSKF